MRDPKIGDKVTLTEVEIAWCVGIADRRTKANREAGRVGRPLGSLTLEQIELYGAGGELGFAKLWNAYPDFTTHPRSSRQGDDHGDCTLHIGLTVDPKTTHYKNGVLPLPPWKKKNVDLYALMIGCIPTYTFMGFMVAEELLRRTPKPLGRPDPDDHGKRSLAKQAAQSELRNLDELIKSVDESGCAVTLWLPEPEMMSAW